MSTERFTPGPWEVDGFDLVSIITNTTPGTSFAAWKHISKCDYGYLNPEKHFEENKANAKLIAAAPELLEALIGFRDYFKWLVKDTSFKAFADAEAAIQKATQ
jgi:hypothetical protein